MGLLTVVVPVAEVSACLLTQDATPFAAFTRTAQALLTAAFYATQSGKYAYPPWLTVEQPATAMMTVGGLETDAQAATCKVTLA
mmetsp:Transcript_20242/g.28835  ORF Transcript_20242/g.28835 Transcript_20242/m.28835 type:complete len:84 (-) Transcript_20242:207-458(-)